MLAGVALIATCYGFARFAYGLFAGRFAEEFALSASLTGLIASGGYVGYCVAIGLSTALTSRWGPRVIAVAAGATATLGITLVAVASSSTTLAVGVLVAGSSTGIASPPLAAAVARGVREDARDTAQTVVNAGTGIGVLLSGPVALVLLDEWRLAWGLFAVITAGVTVWVGLAVPAGRTGTSSSEGKNSVWTTGAGPLIVGSLALGLASAAVWTFGQQISTASRVGWLPPVLWMVIGAAGIAGALSGPVVERLGVRRSWTLLMMIMAVGVAGLAAGAAVPVLALVAGALFGAAYIALSGVLLVWATRTYGSRPALGVGLSFFAIAAGQALGAPLVGAGSDAFGLPVVFYVSALVAVVAAWLVRADPGRPAPARGSAPTAV